MCIIDIRNIVLSKLRVFIIRLRSTHLTCIIIFINMDEHIHVFKILTKKSDYKVYFPKK